MMLFMANGFAPLFHVSNITTELEVNSPYRTQISLNCSYTLYDACFLQSTITKYYWNDQIKKDEMGRTCSAHGKDEKLIQVLAGNYEGKRTLEKPRNRWEMTLKFILGTYGLRMWIGFTWLRIGTGRGFL
jgi:hypothetical protein